MDFGSRIRAARRAAGLSQEELARRADMSLKGMGDIERGVIPDPHFSSLSKIANGLGISIGELLEEPSSPKAPAPTSSANPPSSSAATAAGQQSVESRALEAFDALSSYVEQRATMYEEDLKDPNSPLFADSGTATVWASTVNREAFMLAGLVGAQAKPLFRSMTSAESRRTAKHHVQRIAQHLKELAKVSVWIQEHFADEHSPLDTAAQEPSGIMTGGQHIDMTKPQPLGKFIGGQHIDMTQPGEWAAVSRQAAQALQSTAKEIQKQVA